MRIWGNPVEFKEFNIYPVKMKDCEKFYENVSCLMYEKNKIQDIQIIRMDYLTFIFALMQQDEEIYKRLDYILKLVLRDQPFHFMYSDDGSIYLCVYDVVISGYDFEIFRKIVLQENSIKVDEEILDAEAEKSLRESEEFTNRNNEPATLEERIVAYHCVSKSDYSKIAEYTILQFTLGLQRFDLIKNFDTYSSLMAEHGSSKEITHWLSHIKETGRYDHVKITQEEFDKIKSESGLTEK